MIKFKNQIAKYGSKIALTGALAVPFMANAAGESGVVIVQTLASLADLVTVCAGLGTAYLAVVVVIKGYKVIRGAF